MAKLTKQEINAIASRLHRKLTEIVLTNREKKIKDYVPSDTYNKILALVEKRDELTNIISNMNETMSLIIKDISKIMLEVYSSKYVEHNSKESIINIIKNTECQCQVPSLDELKENIIIEAIDEDFNVDDFINKQLSLYQ